MHFYSKWKGIVWYVKINMHFHLFPLLFLFVLNVYDYKYMQYVYCMNLYEIASFIHRQNKQAYEVTAQKRVFAIILTRKRELVVLLLLSVGCHVTVDVV